LPDIRRHRVGREPDHHESRLGITSMNWPPKPCAENRGRSGVRLEPSVGRRASELITVSRREPPQIAERVVTLGGVVAAATHAAGRLCAFFHLPPCR